MSDLLRKIESTLDEINKQLISQSREISTLREQVNQLTSNKTFSAFIEPECDYAWIGLHINVDASTWSRIKAGEFVSIKGIGWSLDTSDKPDPTDENFYWDHWEFNGGINKPMKVTMESPRGDDVDFVDQEDKIAYEGPLLQAFVFETPSA